MSRAQRRTTGSRLASYTAATEVSEWTFAAVHDCMNRLRLLPAPDRLNAVAILARVWTDNIAGFRDDPATSRDEPLGRRAER